MKKQLKSLKNRYITIIYGGLSRQESVKSIHKRLYDETINAKKQGEAVSDNMLKVAFSFASKLKKKTENQAFMISDMKKKYGTDEHQSASVLVAMFVFDLLKKKNVEKTLSKEITKETDKVEGKEKELAIGDAIDTNFLRSRGAEDLSSIHVFYLASSHKDSASDHKDYQGKIYVDENWRKLNISNELKEKIRNYVKSHYIRTIQWVMGRPVWFITRPNCRHYFKEVNAEEVISSTAGTLLNKYEMKTAIGDRQYLQTIKHAVNKEWYDDVRNAELLLDSYKERLSMHEGMYKESPSPLLKSAIQKDKMLIEKWRKYIESKK